MTAYKIPIRWSDSDCFKIRRAGSSGNEKYLARTDAFTQTATHSGGSFSLSCRGNRSEGGADIPVCPHPGVLSPWIKIDEGAKMTKRPRTSSSTEAMRHVRSRRREILRLRSE